MAEQTVAASSPAEAADVFGGQTPTLAEYNHWHETKELPERFKQTATQAEGPADSPEQTVVESEGDEPETESDSEPEEAQEPPQKGSAAEKRIKQLLAQNKELQRKLETVAKPDVKTESSTAPTPQAATRPEPTPDDKNPDGTPKYATYEKYVKDLARWEIEQELAQYERKQAHQQALKALQAKVDEARARYEDADAVILPTGKAIREAQIPAAVRAVLEESENFLDLLYVVGSDPDELKSFISLAQNNPRGAIAKIFEYERGIKDELSKTTEPPESGKAPEPRKTSAPKPPSPVSGGSSRAFDVSDESLSPEEWARKRTQDLKRRGK